MIKGRCVSVTDLRKSTKECLDGLHDSPKYVFINNKPVAVLIDIDQYEELFYETDFVELKEGEVTQNLLDKANKALTLDESELLNV